jgi:hypothetical protein
VATGKPVVAMKPSSGKTPLASGPTLASVSASRLSGIGNRQIE